ncbi:hypothetical protein [Pseudonocardia sp.]|jgi:uncharacterized protein YecT (DUF1311 family)|uniref:hypothetical protein n=1 Tax=Pseudonocardia sp. TaxID=60912 RepID=UPI0031FC0491
MGLLGFGTLTAPKACKEAPKPSCDKDDDDKDSRPVCRHHKHHHQDKKKSSCGCG